MQQVTRNEHGVGSYQQIEDILHCLDSLENQNDDLNPFQESNSKTRGFFV